MKHPNEINKFQIVEQSFAYKNICIAVLGAGYVGLPTAALFANAGYTVTAIDVKTAIVESINKGVSPIKESDYQDVINERDIKGCYYM